MCDLRVTDSICRMMNAEGRMNTKVAPFHSAFCIHHSAFKSSSSPQVPDCLQRLIRGLDRLAVQLERPLRLDQRDQLLDRIDVAAFEESAEDGAGAAFAGLGVD